jgi:hypothetical protein
MGFHILDLGTIYHPLQVGKVDIIQIYGHDVPLPITSSLFIGGG